MLTPTLILSGLDSIGDIAVDSSYVYWSINLVPGTLNRANLDGSGSTILTTIPSDVPTHIAVDGVNIYWGSQAGAVSQMPKAGGTITTLQVDGNGAVGGLAIDSSYVYWTAGGQVHRTPIGSGAITTIASGLNNPSSLAVDGSNVYWVEGGTFAGSNGSVSQRAKDGSGSVTVLASSRNTPSAIAIDSVNVCWAELSSNSSNTQLNKVPIGGGTITLFASFPNIAGVDSLVIDSSGNLYAEGVDFNNPHAYPQVIGVNTSTSSVGVLWTDTSGPLTDVAGSALLAGNINDVLYWSNYQFSAGTGVIYSITTVAANVLASSSVAGSPTVQAFPVADLQGSSDVAATATVNCVASAPFPGEAFLSASYAIINPVWMAFNYNTLKIYVLDLTNLLIWIYDATALAYVGPAFDISSIPNIASGLYKIDIDPSSNTLWLSDANVSVFAVDGSTGAITPVDETAYLSPSSTINDFGVNAGFAPSSVLYVSDSGGQITFFSAIDGSYQGGTYPPQTYAESIVGLNSAGSDESGVVPGIAFGPDGVWPGLATVSNPPIPFTIETSPNLYSTTTDDFGSYLQLAAIQDVFGTGNYGISIFTFNGPETSTNFWPGNSFTGYLIPVSTAPGADITTQFFFGLDNNGSLYEMAYPGWTPVLRTTFPEYCVQILPYGVFEAGGDSIWALGISGTIYQERLSNALSAAATPSGNSTLVASAAVVVPVAASLQGDSAVNAYASISQEASAAVAGGAHVTANGFLPSHSQIRASSRLYTDPTKVILMPFFRPALGPAPTIATGPQPLKNVVLPPQVSIQPPPPSSTLHKGLRRVKS